MIAEDHFLVITLRARGMFFNQQSKLFWLSSDSISDAKVVIEQQSSKQNR